MITNCTGLVGTQETKYKGVQCSYFTNQCSTSILHRISKLDSTSNGNPIIYHFWGTKLIQDNIPAYRYQRDENKAGNETLQQDTSKVSTRTKGISQISLPWLNLVDVKFIRQKA
jgi:hypothetical protein